MARFCGSCGAQLSDTGAFCLQCGTAQNSAAQAPSQAQPSSPFQSQSPSPFQSQPQPPFQANPQSPPQPSAQGGYTPVNVPGQQQAYTPVNAQPPVQYTPVNPQGGPSISAPPPVAKGSNTGIKIVLGILAVLFVGAVVVAGALFYVGHKVVNKIKTAAAENGLSMPSNSSGEESASAAAHSDFCSMLSKDDVGAAIGVPIVATQSTYQGCEYLAHGTSTDMTARHMSAMAGAKGADSQSQDQVHQMIGAFLKSGQIEKDTADANGNVPVMVFSVDTTGAREQMQLNSKVLGVLGPVGATPLPGIGDEAFDSSNAMMFVRKGDKLIRIMYTMCPCNTEAIKPLARKLADAL